MVRIHLYASGHWIRWNHLELHWTIRRQWVGQCWKDLGSRNRHEEWRRTTNSWARFTSIHLGQSPTLISRRSHPSALDGMAHIRNVCVPFIQCAHGFVPEDVMFFSRYHWCCPTSSPCPCLPWGGHWEKRAWRNLEPRLHRTGHQLEPVRNLRLGFEP